MKEVVKGMRVKFVGHEERHLFGHDMEAKTGTIIDTFDSGGVIVDWDTQNPANIPLRFEYIEGIYLHNMVDHPFGKYVIE